MDKVRAGAISNNHCSTAACRDSSIPSYIGWMFLSDSCTSSASWCSTACMVKHLRTSWNILCQPVAGVIPSYIGWMFLSDSVQARRHGVQLPAQSSASVPRGIVPASRRCRITATSSLCCPAAPGRTASPAQLLWPTGFLCGWSVVL